MIYLQLFAIFFIIGLVSFGGGYGMIPLIHDFVVDRFGWMISTEFTDTIAIAGMAPGPIAVNSAAIIGYEQAGIVGTVASVIGIVLPSFVIILALAMLAKKFHQHRIVQSAYYGLKPAITSLILYAAIVMAMNNGLVADWSWHTLSQVIIFICSLAALLFVRIHPLIVLLASGVVGAILYN